MNSFFSDREAREFVAAAVRAAIRGEPATTLQQTRSLIAALDHLESAHPNDKKRAFIVIGANAALGLLEQAKTVNQVHRLFIHVQREIKQ